MSQRIKALEQRVGQVLIVREKPCKATVAGIPLVRLAAHAPESLTSVLSRCSQTPPEPLCQAVVFRAVFVHCVPVGLPRPCRLHGGEVVAPVDFGTGNEVVGVARQPYGCHRIAPPSSAQQLLRPLLLSRDRRPRTCARARNSRRSYQNGTGSLEVGITLHRSTNSLR